MTREELLEAIDYTMYEIGKVKRQIKEATDPREKRLLTRR